VYLPRIKVCCITSPEEARLAIGHGAHALGLVSAMPSGPGVIDDAEIAEIAAQVPPGVATFLLTAVQDAEGLIAQQRHTRASALQLVDRVPTEVYPRLREALPGIAIVQVVHVRGDDALDESCEVAPYVDALLLDSGDPTLAVRELGGTGRVHDWALSRRIVAEVGRPVYLAGGLGPENVAEAIRTVRPFGVDICSGLRSQGHLDEHKLSAFVRAVRSTDEL
jgi:phosphoribosylanthranilate isomerase